MSGDPELEAISAVSSALSSLEDDAARGRVLRWAAERFDVALPSGGSRRRDSRDACDLDDVGGYDGQGSGTPPAFDEFADLYDTASPKSNSNKALVAAYWHQKIMGNDSFGSQPLNKILKDMGHGLERINDALAASMKTDPKLILQLRKTGNATQGRKMYKVTNEGLRAVERMIAGGAE